MKKVIVRFAPSPTGFLHIGGLRTALFNWLWARKNKGRFILRIEDTDRERIVKGTVENIQEALQWYGLDIDEGPVFQSGRLTIYKKYVEQLIKQGSAYYCFCSAERLAEVRKIQQVNKQAIKYDGLCRSLADEEVQKKLQESEQYVVRLKIPSAGQTTFNDLIYGGITVENINIDDQVLLKSDGYPTYHLANVVDDHEAGITHVIRAEEWLPSTPKHIIIYQAFGWPVPVFAHLPMVLGSDKAKLSKRHGAVSALEYKKLGYLPEAVLNFIALLGWNPKTNQEIFSVKELIQEFDLTKVNKSSAIFNIKKLDWLNGQYIKKMDINQLMKVAEPFFNKKISALPTKTLKMFVKISQDRLKKLTDLNQVNSFLLDDDIDYDPEILVPPGEKKEEAQRSLGLIVNLIKENKSQDFNKDKLKSIFETFIKENGLNNRIVLWPLRVAITGQKKSPGVFEIMELLGKEKVLKRVVKALERLQKR